MTATANAQGGSTYRVERVMDEDSDPTPFELTLQASDDDAKVITWRIAIPAKHGKAAVEARGDTRDIQYVPEPNWSGVDRFVIQVDDGNGGISSVEIIVQVRPRNDAPTNTVKPFILGNRKVGQVLGVDPGQWNDDLDQTPGPI